MIHGGYPMNIVFVQLPALIITLQQFYETTESAEVFGLSTILAKLCRSSQYYSSF